MKAKVPALVKDPPNHRHYLAKSHLIQGFSSILDVGGISYKKSGDIWVRELGAPKEVWGVTHSLDKEKDKPYIYTINVVRDYDRQTRRPDLYYDGLHIPFANSSYDIVTSIDVLEHVPNKERMRVISEMIRVAKQKVIIVVPFFSFENIEMEEDILKDMKSKNIQPKPSLAEHRAFELPKISEIEKYLKAHKLKYKISYGTHRPIMKQYYFFQNTINSLLNIPGNSKEQLMKILVMVMEVAGNVFNISKKVEKKDAYRAIISITK